MYQNKQIIYKSIFKSGNDKETVELKGNGIVEIGNKIHISFKANDLNIDITCNGERVVLKNNHSVLKLIKDKMVLNEYQLAYGTTLLKTKMLQCKYREDRFQLVYELYDTNTLISTVYIIINMI